MPVPRHQAGRETDDPTLFGLAAKYQAERRFSVETPASRTRSLTLRDFVLL